MIEIALPQWLAIAALLSLAVSFTGFGMILAMFFQR
jgi:hypothetical protein